MHLRVLVFALLFSFTQLAHAQQANWIQLEAHRTLQEAEARARDYSGTFNNIRGFRLNSGWYALALGPFASEQALTELQSLRAGRIIPSDAYTTDSSVYGAPFWPIGARAANTATVPITPAPTPTPEPQPVADLDETPAQARQSERLLSREEREELQTYLQWFGFYRARIDGAFGPGTRRSMAAWQDANGRESTGILTTRQRADLKAAYQEALAALGLETVRDTQAGLELTMPARLVEFEEYDYPFAKFRPRGDSAVQVLLISQPGNSARLAGLFNIMQTLEIVPRTGERVLNAREFTLTGQNSQVHSHSYARVENEQIKGFTLAYPPEKEAEMQRAIAFMRDSLTFLDGVLTLEDSQTEGQSVDLLAGLALRQPKSATSGIFVSPEGAVLTSASDLAQCERVTLGENIDVDIISSSNGLTLLQPTNAAAPLAVAQFAETVGRLRSDVAVSGFSYAGALGAPTVTYGTLEDIRGLQGEQDLQRLSIRTLDGDTGGPVLNMRGAVAGVLLPASQEGRQLPEDVAFATKPEAILAFLESGGIRLRTNADDAPIAPEDLAKRASEITALVTCW
ncbi:MAG: serine protease [Pseudomonadota bacterium]